MWRLCINNKHILTFKTELCYAQEKFGYFSLVDFGMASGCFRMTGGTLETTSMGERIERLATWKPRGS